MKTVAIIPIKQHSSRLPNKNFNDFCGKPLYQWVVDSALETKEIDEVHISSSWEEFRSEVKKRYGGRVSWIQRPDYLNNVELMEVMQHAAHLIGEEGDIFIQLAPTKPLTSSYHLKRFINEFKNGEYDSLFQIQEITESINWKYKSATQNGKINFKSCAMAKIWDYTTLKNAKKGTWGFGENHCDLFVEKYHIEIDDIKDYQIAKALKEAGY